MIDHGHSPAGFAIITILTHADDGLEPSAKARENLRRHDRVRLPMKRATF
jgi:hypothetical protein